MHPNEIERLRQLLEELRVVLAATQLRRTDTPQSPIPSAREPVSPRPWERVAVHPPSEPPSSAGHDVGDPTSGDFRDAQIRALIDLVREAVPIVSRAEDWGMARYWLDRADALGCRR